MSEDTETTKPCPENWLHLLVEELDFEGAYRALDGFTHFHTETLRGKVRSFQLRLDEARDHYKTANRLHRQQADPGREKDCLYYFFLKAYEYDNATLQEALSPVDASVEATDSALEALLELDEPDLLVTTQLKIDLIGYHQLLRADYVSALKTFKTLIDESSGRFEDQQVSFFTGAAAAAHELGLTHVAYRYYENASLGANSLMQPLKVGLFCARLYALLGHWNRRDEATEWLSRLDSLRCPAASRDLLRQRAKLFETATSSRGRVFLS